MLRLPSAMAPPGDDIALLAIRRKARADNRLDP
jgi:hypothetical protein